MALGHNPSLPPQDAEEAELRETFQLAAPPDARCLFCCEPVTYPSIYWAGLDHVWLHVECAARLSAGLMRDVAEYMYLSDLRTRLVDRS